jgi:predicted transcriptional regulator
VLYKYIEGVLKMNLTEIQRQLLKELEAGRERGLYTQLLEALKAKQGKGIDGLDTQLGKEIKERADILSELKKYFVVEEENNEKEEDSK